MAMRTKTTSEVARSSGRRSRHSSQGSSRMGASGCSNNTSVDLDYRYSYKVEDTPVTFSRNSSLSSLSVNSNDEEPSAEDQALLDNCISWGMPKSKSDFLDGRTEQAKKTKSTKTTGAKIPSSQSWGGGVRRAGDGQASASPSTAAVTASSSFSAFSAGNCPSPAIDPSDIVVKLEEPDPNSSPSMTHSSLIRLEANQIAAHIQNQDSLDGLSQCNDLEHFPSLSSSFIDGAASWTDSSRKSPSLPRKTQTCQTDSNRGRTPVNGANPLLKQALSSGLVMSTDQSNMTCSSSSVRIENTKPPAELLASKVTDSLTSLTCSVLDPAYFDDEQRREGLLTQLAIMEHTVDENANTDSSVSSSPTERRKTIGPTKSTKIATHLHSQCQSGGRNHRKRAFHSKQTRQPFETTAKKSRIKALRDHDADDFHHCRRRRVSQQSGGRVQPEEYECLGIVRLGIGCQSCDPHVEGRSETQPEKQQFFRIDQRRVHAGLRNS